MEGGLSFKVQRAGGEAGWNIRKVEDKEIDRRGWGVILRKRGDQGREGLHDDEALFGEVREVVFPLTLWQSPPSLCSSFFPNFF